MTDGSGNCHRKQTEPTGAAPVQPALARAAGAARLPGRRRVIPMRRAHVTHESPPRTEVRWPFTKLRSGGAGGHKLGLESGLVQKSHNLESQPATAQQEPLTPW